MQTNGQIYTIAKNIQKLMSRLVSGGRPHSPSSNLVDIGLGFIINFYFIYWDYIEGKVEISVLCLLS